MAGGGPLSANSTSSDLDKEGKQRKDKKNERADKEYAPPSIIVGHSCLKLSRKLKHKIIALPPLLFLPRSKSPNQSQISTTNDLSFFHDHFYSSTSTLLLSAFCLTVHSPEENIVIQDLTQISSTN